MKQTANLENWYFIHGVLFGDVYNHPKLNDGSLIRTSEVISISEDLKTAETLNTFYTLGKKLDGLRNESPEVQL
jgi:hypothetical protein